MSNCEGLLMATIALMGIIVFLLSLVLFEAYRVLRKCRERHEHYAKLREGRHNAQHATAVAG